MEVRVTMILCFLLSLIHYWLCISATLSVQFQDSTKRRSCYYRMFWSSGCRMHTTCNCCRPSEPDCIPTMVPPYMVAAILMVDYMPRSMPIETHPEPLLRILDFGSGVCLGLMNDVNHLIPPAWAYCQGEIWLLPQVTFTVCCGPEIIFYDHPGTKGMCKAISGLWCARSANLIP